MNVQIYIKVDGTELPVYVDRNPYRILFVPFISYTASPVFVQHLTTLDSSAV
jgi:hypothetical protein